MSAGLQFRNIVIKNGRYVLTGTSFYTSCWEMYALFMGGWQVLLLQWSSGMYQKSLSKVNLEFLGERKPVANCSVNLELGDKILSFPIMVLGKEVMIYFIMRFACQVYVVLPGTCSQCRALHCYCTCSLAQSIPQSSSAPFEFAAPATKWAYRLLIFHTNNLYLHRYLLTPGWWWL